MTPIVTPTLPARPRRLTTRALAALAAAIALAGAAGVAGAQGYPTEPPPPGPIEPAAFPPFREVTLSNGVRLVLVESHDHPVVSASLAFPAGASYAPAGKEGIAGLLAGTLTKGAGQRSAEAISREIESAGGSLNASAGADFLTISVDALSDRAALAFELLGDAAARATLPEQEVALAQQQTLSGLKLQQGQPGSLAQRNFLAALYGAHPYARQATPETVQGITRADLAAYRDARLKPQDATLVVAGDITLADARRLAEQAFRGWTGKAAAAPARPAPPRRTSPSLILVHRPGSVQSTLLAGNTTFAPNDSQYYAAVVANKVLGGGTSGRLFAILREQKGYTYDASSNLVLRKDLGYLAAQTDVRTEVTDSALVEMLAQMRRVGAERVTADTLASAKSTLVGSFPLTVETAEQVAGAVLTARLYGRPDDYLRTYRTKLAAVTAPELQAAAQRLIRPQQGVIVVVGDGAQIYEKIKGIAPVTIVNPQGDTLQPSDLAGAVASAPRFDPSRLRAGRDSFAIVVQGNAMGSMVREVVKGNDGWTIRDVTALPALGLDQKTEVALDGQLAFRSVTQEGQFQGRPVTVRLTSADGRVTGTSSTPASQFQEKAIDVALPAGAIDDNALQSVLVALPLSPKQSVTIPVLSSGTGAVQALTLTVAGEETVTVPAGTFQAYKVDVTGGQAPVQMWVTTQAPYRVLKIAPVGQPVEFQLVQ